MNIKDRWLIVRRALLVAFNPDVEAVIVTRVDKQGKHHKNCIYTDYDVGKHAYLEHMYDMFTSEANSGDSLNRVSLVFMKGVQDRWNKLHPDDKVSFIEETEIVK